MTDDYIHSEVMGHNYGLTTIMLTNMMSQAPNQDIRCLLGLALLYDFSLWSGSIPEIRVYKAFREFGAVDAEFVPFWHTGGIIRGQTEQVRCSAYLKKEGGAMLVFFNRAREARKMTFTVQWSRLNARQPVEARDAFPAGWDELVDNDLPVQGSQLTVNVPAEGFLMVSVR